MGDSVFAGSPFLRESAALDHRAAGARDDLRDRQDRAAHDLRAAGRSGDPERVHDVARRLERALAVARRDLGPSDPDTLVVEGNLAVAHLLAGDGARGLALAERNLAARERVLGADHPAALSAADAVAAAHRITGNPQEALARHRDVLERRTRVLGGTHPDTVASQAALAVARADTGDLGGAAGLLSSALDTANRSLGTSHPVAADVRDLLAECVDAQRHEESVTERTSQITPVTGPRTGRRAFFDSPSGPLPAVS